jgi:ribose transport system substrate-binding protein
VDRQRELEAEAAEAVRHYADRGASRRSIVKKIGLGVLAAPMVGSVLAACASDEDPKAVAGELGKGGASKLKMLGTNGGLAATWYAQGKAAMEKWAGAYGITVDWVDGELDSKVQRDRLDDAAAQHKYDIAAVIANETGTIVQPVRRLIDKGTTVIEMVNKIAPEGESLDVLTFVEQSSYDMGFQVASALFDKAGGSGTVIETQGPAAFTGAQERHRGFEDALKAYPNMKLLATDFGNWDVNRAQSLWESYINKHSEITVGYFHNDDMALAGLQALKSAGRDGKTLIGGADAMPPAVEAVLDGRMFATARHSSSRVHMYPVVIGVAHKLGAIKKVPDKVIVEGPLVSKENAESVLFLQDDAILLA